MKLRGVLLLSAALVMMLSGLAVAFLNYEINADSR